MSQMEPQPTESPRSARSRRAAPEGAADDAPAAKKQRMLLADAAKIGEVCAIAIGEIVASAESDLQDPFLSAISHDQAGGKKYKRNEDRVSELKQQLRAVFNIQQLPSVAKRRAMTEVPVDQFYETHYTQWREFLEVDGPAGLDVSSVFGIQFLRTLIMACGQSILKEIRKTSLRSKEDILWMLLSEACGFTNEQEVMLLNHVFQVDKASPERESTLSSETGIGFSKRDYGGAVEEYSGIITFECITNDRQPENLVKLITLKNIFARQLPKMPREYIVRLVFDRNHCSFCLLKKGRIIGGTCFRPYFPQRFAEIAFLAVTSTEQVKGYGTRVMNHLKEHVKRAGIDYFLTYADNFAIGYFRKQGFSQKITLPRDSWRGYIKDYDGGTLMQCHINSKIDYLRLSEMLAEQKRVVRHAIRHVKPTHTYPGLTFWKENPSGVFHPSQIPGLVKAGWREVDEREAEARNRPLADQILAVLEILNRHENAWPFRKPVSAHEAPDYFEVITKPMDISTLKKNAKKGEYKSLEQFKADMNLMFSNCQAYNASSTIYYKYAEELKAFIEPKVDALRP